MSLFVIIILAFTTSILLGNNYALYTSYEQAYKEVESLSFETKEAFTVNKNLNEALVRLEEENYLLKNSYFSLINEKKVTNEELSKIKKQNEELQLLNNKLLSEKDKLINNNNEIIDDNIALQNSLKLAASVGIKPQNYSAFKGVSSRSNFNKENYIGKFLGTAYTPSIDECGNDKGITNSGKPIVPGISLAIDKEYWPFGTIFYIKGLGYAIAMDTGNAVKGKYRFDFAVFDKEFAKAIGSKEWDVYLVRMGDGKVNELDF